MKRWMAVGLGAAALSAAILAAAQGRLVAGQDPGREAEREAREAEAEAGKAEREARNAEKEARKAERAVQIFAQGGGGRLGVSLADVRAEDLGRLKLTEERGALVRSVEDESAAAAAGLKAGDVILTYDGETVRSAGHLARLVRETPAGRKVALDVSRDGVRQRLTATLREPRGFRFSGELPDFDFDFDVDELVAPRPPRAPRAPRPPRPPLLDEDFGGFFQGRRHTGRLGIGYQEVEGQLARYFKLEDRGVLVTHVEEDSPAARGGLKAGDVIVKVDGKPVRGGSDLRAALREAEPGRTVRLGILREGRASEVSVTLREREGIRRSERPV